MTKFFKAIFMPSKVLSFVILMSNYLNAQFEFLKIHKFTLKYLVASFCMLLRRPQLKVFRVSKNGKRRWIGLMTPLVLAVKTQR